MLTIWYAEGPEPSTLRTLGGFHKVSKESTQYFLPPGLKIIEENQLEEGTMHHTWSRTFWTIWKDRRGQDLIEYAMLAGFIAVAVAAFFPQDIAPSISRIFSTVASQLNSSPQG